MMNIDLTRPNLAKPRTVRLTSLLDKGLPLNILTAYLQESSPYIDIAKIGWGLCFLESNLQEKLSIYSTHNISCCPGGTLFEYFITKSNFDSYLQYVKDAGFTACEISDGTIEMNQSFKLDCIKAVRDAGFTCISEVGSKDPSQLVSPIKWCKQIEAELAAGAQYVILEGRESGTSGMYRQSGEMRYGLLDEILDYGISLETLIFEAPSKDYQSQLINLLGPNINLGNIDILDVKPLESLRCGLRSDTLLCDFI